MQTAAAHPSCNRCDTASRSAAAVTLTSNAPRPQTNPSASFPLKGGCVHLSGGPTATTSRWLTQSTGFRAGSEPGHLNRRLSSLTCAQGCAS